jgi:nitrite reductase (NADH) small subunit
MNPESIAEFARVAEVSEIPPGTAKAFSVGRFEVAVFNVAGQFHALENSCPHQGGPLADGWLENEVITCPWHAWCFNVRTGKMTLGDFAFIPRFGVRVHDGLIWVRTEPEREA